MKQIQHLLVTLLLLSLITSFPLRAQAASNKEYIGHGVYCIFTIEKISAPYPTHANYCIQAIMANHKEKTKTAKKTVTYKDSSNNTLWSVTVTGTFSYNGSSSSCKKASVSGTSYHSNWVVTNKKCSKSGNKATASATGKEYVDDKVAISINKTVSVSCSKSGDIS